MPVKAYVAVATTVLLWAGSITVTKIGLEALGAPELASLHFAVAAVPAALWLLIKRRPLPKPVDGLRFIGCSALGIALYNLLVNAGQMTVSPGAAGFIINTAPVFTALLAATFLHEQFGARGWLGTAVCIAGVFIIATGQPGGLRLGAGASWLALAAICDATFIIVQRPLIQRYGAARATAYTLLAGSLCLSPWLWSGLQDFAAAPERQRLAVLYLGLLAGSVAYATWFYALGKLGASRATVFLYLISPIAMLIAFLVYRDQPTASMLVGGACTLIGVIVATAPRTGTSTRSRRKAK
jgi:drug/metabolite transporter (DMT)-like permease